MPVPANFKADARKFLRDLLIAPLFFAAATDVGPSWAGHSPMPDVP